MPVMSSIILTAAFLAAIIALVIAAMEQKPYEFFSALTAALILLAELLRRYRIWNKLRS